MKRTALITLSILTASLTAKTEKVDSITYTLPNNQTIQTFLPESDNSGWAVQAGGQLLYFADGTFIPLSGTPPEGRNYYENIMGDASRGFYQQRYIDTENKTIKLIYKLVDGKAHLHCKPIRVNDALGSGKGSYTYIAKEGKIISWNDSHYLLWLNDKWHKLPFDDSLSKSPPLFFEHSSFIIVVMDSMFYIINPEGEVKEISTKEKTRIVNCQAWDKNTMIALHAADSSLSAFDIRTGARKTLPQEFNRISESIRDMQRSPNGILWCFTDKSIYRLSPDCTASKIERPGSDAMVVLAISDTKELSKPLKDDTRWDIFYLNEESELSSLNSQGVIDYTSRMNLINKPRSVIASTSRKIWILTGTAENRLIDIDLDGQRTQSRLNATELWQIYKIRQQTPLLGNNGFIAFFSDKDNSLLRWNGKKFTETQLPDIFHHPISDIAIDSRGVIYCIVFMSDGFKNERLYEISHNGTQLLSEDRTGRFFHMMEIAISRSIAEGATSFNWVGDEDVLITTDRHAWVRTKNSNVLKYYSGGVWKSVRHAKTPDDIIETENQKVAIHMKDEGWFVFNEGLFDQSISIPSVGYREDERVIYKKSPMQDRRIESRYSDLNGNIWLWLRDENRVARCQTDKVKIVLNNSPQSSSADNIMIQATTLPSLDGIRFAYRISPESDWRPFNSPVNNQARIYFPSSGIYQCEVAAFYMGERLSNTSKFKFTANVVYPETILTEDINNKEPLLIKNTLWHPPVKSSASSYEREQSCEISWRITGSNAWDKLEEDGTFPLYKLLTNGIYSVEFAAIEEWFTRDQSPLTLNLKLSLDERDLLRLTLKALSFEDGPNKTTAKTILKNNRSRWETLLPSVRTDALEARKKLDILRSIERFLPHDLEELQLDVD